MKRRKLSHWNVTTVCLLLAFCCVAWLTKDSVTEHVPETYLGLFAACSIANAALFPSVSLLLILPFVSILPLYGVAFFAALGASLGEMTGYYLGFCGRNVLNQKVVKKVQGMFSKHKGLWVFIFCILPLPVFDVIGILAGSVRMNPFRFYVSCFAGKFLKMFAVGWLAGELVLLLF